MDGQLQSPWWRRPGGLALASLAVIAVFYLLMEHTAHVLGTLPYLLLLLCPALHLFHHRGHGHHRHSEPPTTHQPQGRGTA